MMNELARLRELTEAITSGKILDNHTKEWEYALNAIPDLIIIIDTDDIIKFVNKSFIKSAKTSQETIIGKGCKETLFKELGFIYECCYSLCGEQYIKRLNGWFDGTVTPIFDDNDYLIGHIVVLRDTTSYKNIEKLLRVQRDIAVAIGVSEDVYSLLSSVIHVAVDAIDIDWGCIYLWDKELNTFNFYYETGDDYCLPLSFYTISSTSIEYSLIKDGEPSFICDTDEFTGVVAATYGFKSIVFLPIKYKGNIIALVTFGSLTNSTVSDSYNCIVESVFSGIGAPLQRLLTK